MSSLLDRLRRMKAEAIKKHPEDPKGWIEEHWRKLDPIDPKAAKMWRRVLWSWDSL